MLKKINFITIIVVLYKQEWAASKTLNTLMEAESIGTVGFRLKIWDNSPTTTLDIAFFEKISSKFEVMYNHDPLNSPLSRVYNDASMDDDSDFLVIFDQDSSIASNFLSILVSDITGNPGVDLFLPIALHDEVIVSPGSYFLVKGKYVRSASVGMTSSRGKVAIASGMAISKEYFRCFPRPFDEKLNLYGIDTAFMLDYASRRQYLFVTGNVILHDSALLSEPDASFRLKRFRNFRHSAILIHSGRKTFLLCVLYVAYLSVKNAVKHRDRRYIMGG